MDWKEIEGKLSRTYEFKTQTELAHFLLKVAKTADEIKHHPDYTVFKAAHVKFNLFSHDKNKITKLDTDLAEKIETIYKSIS